MIIRFIITTLLLINLGTAKAQTVERDYSQYLRPLVFLLPDAPPAKDGEPVQKYTVALDISPNGTVSLPVTVEPNEPIMVHNINDAARFWLFPPSLTDDCKPGPRTGKVSLEFDTGKGRAWLELAAVTKPVKEYAYTFLNRGNEVKYPKDEIRKDIRAGKVTVAMKLMADGSTMEHVVYIAVPASNGFMTNALNGARKIAVKFLEPLDKQFLCTLITYNFKLAD